MCKIAAVVILYHPNQNVFDNIKTYINKIDFIYIVDNSNYPDRANIVLEEIKLFENYALIHSGRNIGIAKALNLALHHAQKDKYSWLITMDQDTSFEYKQLQKYFKDFYTIDTTNIAIISPLHNRKLVNSMLNQNPFVAKEYVMTSANIVNVNHALDIGGYDENLFIDEVDHAFCFALQDSQYTILENQTVFVHHELGTPYKKNSDIKLYPPIRLYYMCRNYLYLRKKYRILHKSFFKRRGSYLIKFFIIQLIYSDQKIKSFKMILRGLSDYYHKKFGKQHED